MADRHRIDLEPAAAAAALGRGDRAVSNAWSALVRGEISALRIGRPAARKAPDAAPGCLLPGSFNPVHEGHRRMLAAAAAARLHAAARLGPGGGGGGVNDVGDDGGVGVGGAAFELAIRNPDKPPLPPEETAARLARFTSAEAVWLTRTPTFPEKARIFPGVTFAVGVDTIVRIADPRYYGGPTGLAAAISALRACRFLVFGRRIGTRFETLESTTVLPEALRALCDGVSEADFRADISSTELRGLRKTGGG